MRKKTVNENKVLAVIIIFTAALIISLIGCSPKNTGPASFQIAFIASSMNQNAVTEYGAYLNNAMPELTIEGKAPVFTPIIIAEAADNPEPGNFVDPMMTMGGMIRMAVIGATGDLDIIISDMNNAERQAASGVFMPLSGFLTNDELSALESRSISFDIMSTDHEPKPTGEKTPVCGINITGNERMRSIFGNQEIGVFITSNTKNLELAKKVVRSLL